MLESNPTPQIYLGALCRGHTSVGANPPDGFRVCVFFEKIGVFSVAVDGSDGKVFEFFNREVTRANCFQTNEVFAVSQELLSVLDGEPTSTQVARGRHKRLKHYWRPFIDHDTVSICSLFGRVKGDVVVLRVSEGEQVL